MIAAIGLRHQYVKVPADEFIFRIAEYAFGLGVDVFNGAVCVGGDRPVGQILENLSNSPLAFLQRKERLLDMSLGEFARSGLRVELRVPGCKQTIWWVPTSRAAVQLMQKGINRGRIWTAEELQRVWDLGGLDQDLQELARIKLQLGCELTAFNASDDGLKS